MKNKNSLASRILALCLSGAMMFNTSGVQALAEELMVNEPIAAEEIYDEPVVIEAEELVEMDHEEDTLSETAPVFDESDEVEDTSEAAETAEVMESQQAEETADEPVVQEESKNDESAETEETEEETAAEEEEEKYELSVLAVEDFADNGKGGTHLSFSIDVQNLSEKADAKDIDIKAVVTNNLVYDSSLSHSENETWISNMQNIPAGLDLHEYLNIADAMEKAYTHALIWNDRQINAGEEQVYHAYLDITDEVGSLDDLGILFFVDGELIPDYHISIHGADVLVKEKAEEVNTQTEYSYTDGYMTVTATLSSPEILPTNAVFVVEEVMPTEEELALAEEMTAEEEMMVGYVTYDMHFEVDGEEVEPEGGEVAIAVTYQVPVEFTPVENEDAERILAEAQKNEDVELSYSIIHITDEDDSSADLVAENVAVNANGDVVGAEFSVENFSRFMLLAAGPTRIPNSADTFPYSYTLTDLLSGYNVIAFGNAQMTIHCMGGVLVQGDFSLTGSGFGDGSDLPPSYIKGIADINGPYNSRNAKTNGPLYLGSINATKGYLDSEGHAIVNGIRFYNPVPVYISDNFFDFGTAYSVVTSGSAYLAKNGYTITDTEIIDVPFGTSVVIPDISQIKRINFTGSESDGGSTVVTILSGDEMPEIRFNGSQPSVKEKGDGTSIVWNLPNSSGTVSVPSQNWIGHILAPNANVKIEGGNYNGCVICQNFFSNAEGHQYPYNGGTLIPTDLELHVTKTVDGKAPSAEEYGKFTFYLDELKRPGAIKPWDNVKTTTNGTAEGNGDVNFGKLLYEQGDEGTHWYRMYEDQTPVKGYILDKEVFYMKVIVESVQSGPNIKYRVANKNLYKAADLTTDVYDLAGGIDVTKLTPITDADISFENSKKQTSTDIELGGKKILYGKNLEANAFTFSIHEADESQNIISGGYSETGVPCDEDGEFAFQKIKYEEAGVYYYVITEDVKSGVTPEYREDGTVVYDGIIYDSKKQFVKVTVTAEDGELVAVADVKNSAIYFGNIYSVEGKTDFSAKKVLEGKELEKNAFSFLLQEVDVDGNPIGDPLTAGNNADGTVDFGSISYKMAATHYYHLTEKAPESGSDRGTTANGNPYTLTYDPAVYNITVVTEDDGKGHLNITKTITVDGTPVSGTPVFTNAYETKAQIPVTGKKTFTGRILNGGEFNFAITDASGKAVATYNINGGMLNTITNDKDGNINFGYLKYTLNDLKDLSGTIQDSKEFTYKVNEVIPADSAKEKGVTYDNTEFTIKVVLTYNKNTGELQAAFGTDSQKANFVNTYATDNSITINGTKVLENRNLKNGEFTFEIKDEKGTVVAAGTNDENGKINFCKAGSTEPFQIVVTLAELQKDPADASKGYETEKFFRYTVSEVQGNDSNITYDKIPQTLLLVAAYDAAAGKINLHWGNGKSGATFTNTYSAETRLSVEGTKILTGRKLNADEFSFAIYEEDGKTKAATYNGTTRIREYKNQEDGKISFGDLVYTLEDLRKADGTLAESKEYTYIIKENAGTKTGVTYDTHSVTVKVLVSYDKTTGKLTSAYKADSQAITFHNIYDTSIKLDLDATKTLTGRDLTEKDNFLFEVVDETGVAVVTNIKTDKTGKINFGEHEFRLSDLKKAGTEDAYESEKTFNFVAREMIPADKAAGITYDRTVYPFKVIVKYDYTTGKMEADFEDLPASGMVFTNIYETSAKDKITVKKTLIGKELENKEFTFVVLDGSKVIAKGQNDETGKVVFHSVDAAENMLDGEYEFEVTLDQMKNASGAYEKQKTFNYTVKEVIPDAPMEKMQYDRHEYTISLVANYDAAAGLLTAAFTEGSRNVEFMNVYEAAGSVNIAGQKILENRDLKAGEFKFRISSATKNADDTFTVGNELYSTTNELNGNIIFKPFTFVLDDMKNADGTYAPEKVWYAHIAEVDSGEENISYDPAEYIAEVTVQYDGTEKLDVKADLLALNSEGKGVQTEQITFTNSYTTSTKIQLDATKKLENLDLAADDFEFELYKVDAENPDGTFVKAVKNNAAGYVDFGELTYDLKDLKDGSNYPDKVFTYLLKEKKTFARADEVKPGIVTNDTNVIRVDVTASYDQKTGIMSTAKKISYSDPSDEQKKAEAEGAAEFINTYAPQAEISLEGTKNLIGRPMKAEEFTFVVKDENGNKVAEGTNAADGKITFTDEKTGKPFVITKTLEDLNGETQAEFKYTVEETAGTDADMTYDDSVKDLALAASYDKTTGKLMLEWRADSDEVVFHNIYDAQTRCYLEATKTLVNGKLKGGEFVFDVYDPVTYTRLYSEDADGNQIDVITNDADGKVVMGWQNYRLSELEDGKGGYLPEKTFVYGITESRNNTIEGVTNDKAFYQIYVTLAYFDDTKELKCGITRIEKGMVASGLGMTTVYEKEIKDITEQDRNQTPLYLEFINTFDKEASEHVVGKKIAPQLTLKGGDFQFTLTDSKGASYVTKDASGNVIDVITNDEFGRIDFGYFTYELKNLYDELKANDWTITYDYFTEEVRTVKPELPGTLKMDDAQYKISVTLNYDETSKALEESIALFKKEADGTYTPAEEISFVNTYDTEVKLPIVGYKSLTGRELKRDEFTVGLYEEGSDKLIKTASNGRTVDGKEAEDVTILTGTFDFTLSDFEAKDAEGNSYYLTDKVFHYIIKEIIPEDEEPKENVSYDADEVRVDVTVRYDKTTGEMSAEYENVTENMRKMTFYNAYTAKASVPVVGQKKLIGRDLKAGEFYFAVYNEQGTLKLHTVNKADGDLEFGELKYGINDMLAVTEEEKTAAENNGGYVPEKVFRYNVVEQNRGEEGITYDDTVFHVAVKVTYDWHTGVLTAELTDDPENDGSKDIVFTNTYESSIKISKVDVISQEELEGATIQIIYKDEDGKEKIFEEWTSTKEPHEVKGLAAGVEYTLRETIAPEGYDITTDTIFVLDENGDLDTSKTTTTISEEGVLLVEDQKSPVNDHASVEVTKNLTLLGDPINAVDETFYVALFNDAEYKQIASEVLPIVFKNASSSTAVFEGLEKDRTYYVAEVTASGEYAPMGTLASGESYTADFNEGNEVVTVENGLTKISFNNEFVEWPEHFYKAASLVITKKLVDANGEGKATDKVFYAGIFTDESCKELYQNCSANLVKLEMHGKDQAESEVIVIQLLTVDDSASIYVAETDENGNPVGEGFGYDVRISATEPDAAGNQIELVKEKAASGLSLTLADDKITVYVNLINVEKSVPTPTPTVTPGPSDTPTPTPSAPKTGDDTRADLYFLLLAAALLAMSGTVYEKRRRQRR